MFTYASLLTKSSYQTFSRNFFRRTFLGKAAAPCGGQLGTIAMILISVFNTYLFFKDFIYLLLERGQGREREGEKHQCVVASCTSPHPGPGLQPRHVP